MEREACVCDHGYERSDLCAEIIIRNGSKDESDSPPPGIVFCFAACHLPLSHQGYGFELLVDSESSKHFIGPELTRGVKKKIYPYTEMNPLMEIKADVYHSFDLLNFHISWYHNLSLAFSAAINFAMKKRSAICSAVLMPFPPRPGLQSSTGRC